MCIRDRSPEERQTTGPKIHALRESVTAALAARKDALEGAALEAKLAAETVDLTLPAPEAPRGSVHPVSQVMDELAELFADLGFAVATGPEIEDDWHNFTALNMPESHPARAMHDTFYIDKAASSYEAQTNQDLSLIHIWVTAAVARTPSALRVRPSKRPASMPIATAR